MGSMDYDMYKKPREQQHRSCRSRALVLTFVVLTISISILLFSGAGGSVLGVRLGDFSPGVHVWNSGTLLRELNVTQYALAASHAELMDLLSRLGAANSLLETLLADTAKSRDMAAAREEQKQAAVGGLWQRELTDEHIRFYD